MNEFTATLKDALGTDLAGCQLVVAYGLTLTHGLMGHFPLVHDQTDGLLLCLSKEGLRKVWERVQQYDLRRVMSFPSCEVLTDDRVDALCALDGEPLKWRPGLLGGTTGDRVRDPDFR